MPSDLSTESQCPLPPSKQLKSKNAKEILSTKTSEGKFHQPKFNSDKKKNTKRIKSDKGVKRPCKTNKNSKGMKVKSTLSHTAKRVTHLPITSKLRNEMEKVKALTHKYDQVMIKSQKLYREFDCFDHQDLIQKVDLFEQAQNRLKESNDLIQHANKAAFFFVNFFKDFEAKLVHNIDVSRDPEIHQICQEIHKEYNLNSQFFDLDQYERCIDANRTMLDSVDPHQDFEDIRLRIIGLKQEIEDHKNHTSECDKSPIDMSSNHMILQSADSMNFTGMLSGTEGDSHIIRSNTEYKDMEDNDLYEPESISNVLDDSLPISVNLQSDHSGIFSGTANKKNIIRQSYSNLETKVISLEKNVGNMIKNEAKLKGEISRLKIERDGFKKMLENNEYFDQLSQSISNISTSLLTNNKIEEVKFNHQIMLKNLVDDSLKENILSLEDKLSCALHRKSDNKEKFLEEINRSNITYSYFYKYAE